MADRLGAAVVRARHRRHDLPDGRVVHRSQPDGGDADRLARAAAGLAAARAPSLLVGRALKEVVPMLMQVAIIVAVVTPFAFDLHLGGVAGRPRWCWRSSASASARCRSPWRWRRRARTGCSGPSSRRCCSRPCSPPACCCRSTGRRAGCEVLSTLNPMTYVVDATRALFAGTFPADASCRASRRRRRRRPRPGGRRAGDAPLELTSDARSPVAGDSPLVGLMSRPDKQDSGAEVSAGQEPRTAGRVARQAAWASATGTSKAPRPRSRRRRCGRSA